MSCVMPWAPYWSIIYPEMICKVSIGYAKIIITNYNNKLNKKIFSVERGTPWAPRTWCEWAWNERMKTNLAYPSPYKTETKTNARHTPLNEHLLHNVRRIGALARWSNAVYGCVCVHVACISKAKASTTRGQSTFLPVSTQSLNICASKVQVHRIYLYICI